MHCPINCPNDRLLRQYIPITVYWLVDSSIRRVQDAPHIQQSSGTKAWGSILEPVCEKLLPFPVLLYIVLHRLYIYFFVYVLANLSLIRGLYEHRMFVRCALQRACAQGAHAVQVSQRSASWFNKASRPFSLYSPRVSANLPSLALHGLVAWE